MNNRIRMILLLILVIFGLNACAATINSVQNTISGRVEANYIATPAEIISALDELAISVQISSSHTPYLVDSKTENSITLIARPLGGASVTDSMVTAHAELIKLSIKAIDKGSYVLLILDPSPSSDMARSSQQQLLKKLDDRFSRYISS